jgi:hypothetical protein
MTQKRKCPHPGDALYFGFDLQTLMKNVREKKRNFSFSKELNK